MLKTESTSINFFRFSTKCLSGFFAFGPMEEGKVREDRMRVKDMCAHGLPEYTDSLHVLK